MIHMVQRTIGAVAAALDTMKRGVTVGDYKQFWCAARTAGRG